MTPKQVKILLDSGVLQAYAEGKEIQYQSPIRDNWIDCKDFNAICTNGNVGIVKWRVKPETKTGWIAIHQDGLRTSSVCKSAFSAISQLGANHTAACLPISYEEGEGLV